ncbi:hypothetical protein LOTGIDRAFT_162025 [Lottia gigantea]|uniref:DNA-directed DNA polymerase n=1 Tax=Lottia gigantea TaxID=225164 RepID=V4A8F0_LOTGI|nr:hypothetical protein LOTGIDRAFT_162025 [Lottia gigantea]ESO93002.1 hypothetical protein LOTGIDRAFT_162025 [Lottia gigantea]
MDEICNILKEYTETASDNIIDLFKEYSASTKDKAEVHSRLKKIKCTKLMAFDANGLYASAMSDLDSEYPRAECGRPFRQEENKEFVKLFNEQKFRPRTAILKVWFEYHTNMFFQPIPAKDKITFRNRIGKKETGNKIRFRNGFSRDVLTSVDIQEIVKAGGRLIKILDAPKIKYNIILTSDGVLKEIKTFKGYSKDKITVDVYIRLANGHDVTNEFKKPWVKRFINGVVIPKDDDKQKKVFRSYLNLVKRKAPDNEGIMYPYNDGKELNMDENYEFDDYDYLTIQEENEEC